jgi:hypothetical protein
MNSSSLVQTRRLLAQGLQAGVYPAPPFKSTNPQTVRFFIKVFTSEMPSGKDLPPSIQRALAESTEADKEELRRKMTKDVRGLFLRGKWECVVV